MKAYSSLIRLHRFHVDEAQRAASELRSDRRQLEENKNEYRRLLQAERLRADEAGTSSDYASFAARIGAAIDAVDENIRQLDMRIEEAQALLSEAYRELKKYEHLEDMRLVSERLDENRREQASFDQTASDQTIRSRRGG